MVNRLKVFFSESSSLVSIVFILGMVILVWVSIADGIVEAIEVGNFFTFLLAISAFLSLQASNASINKKLQIEQQPLVVISLPTRNGDVEEPSPLPSALVVKNIGRGPALSVKVSANRFQGKQLLFDSSQPESIDLAASELKENWNLDEKSLSEILTGQERFSLFTSFSDQLGNMYEMRTDLELENSFWKVVQNTRIV